jgi:ribonuclease HI
LFGNIWWNIPLWREIWLSEAEAWLPSDGLKFYTDGSLFEGRAGSGVLLEEFDLKASFALGTFAAVVQAEFYAIMACSDYCLMECMTGKTICICSDSRAALLALSSHTVSSRLVLQCRNSLQRLSIHNRVQLFWVPGHCGIIENEKADGLAGVGSKFSFCGPEPCLPVPKSLMTRVTKKWLSGNHLSYWNLVSGSRQSKVWIKRPCLKLARFLCTLPTTKLGVLVMGFHPV